MRVGRISLGVFALFLFGVISRTYAACELMPIQTMQAILGVVPDVKVGQTLATLPTSGGGAWQIYCWGNSNGRYPWQLPLLTELNYGASGFSNVFVRSDRSMYGIRYRVNGAIIPGSVIITTLPADADGTYPVQAPSVTLEIVKVRENGEGVFNSIVGLVASSRTQGGADVNIPGLYVHLSALAEPTQPTCTVNTSNITIPLGDVQASALATVGATSPISATQSVVLSCSGNPSVNMTLRGTQASGAPANVLALTQEASAAKGVGVQLLYRNIPLSVDATQNLTTSSGATLTVPIAARYYRTGDLEGGLANAAATLQFAYN
jgi:type 1 fimbria pilin